MGRRERERPNLTLINGGWSSNNVSMHVLYIQYWEGMDMRHTEGGGGNGWNNGHATWEAHRERKG